MVRVLNCVSESVSVISGVPQGSHLGPLLFVIFINDLVPRLEHSSIFLYANDVKIFRNIASPRDASLLQLDLIILSQWSTENGLSLNSSKCNILSFHRSRALEYDYVVHGQSLTRVSTMTDLGIVFLSNLTFSDHIQSCTAKTLRLLGIIFCMSVEFRDPGLLRHLFQTLVLPHLTYGPVIWTPYTQSYARPPESVLHRLLRMLPSRLANRCISEIMIIHAS